MSKAAVLLSAFSDQLLASRKKDNQVFGFLTAPFVLMNLRNIFCPCIQFILQQPAINLTCIEFDLP